MFVLCLATNEKEVEHMALNEPISIFLEVCCSSHLMGFTYLGVEVWPLPMSISWAYTLEHL